MKITHAIEIDSPPATVWSYLEDSEKLKLWMKGLLEDVPTSSGPTGVGSTFRMKIQEGRRTSEYDGEILVFDVDRHMCVRITGGCLGEGMSMTADYRLTPTPSGGTHLAYACTGDVRGFWKLLSPLMQLMVRMQIRSFFRTLKSLAESGGHPLPA